MSLVFSCADGWVVSHLQQLREIYGEVQHERRTCSLRFNEMLFDINSPYLRQGQVTQNETEMEGGENGKGKKRKRSKQTSQEDSEEMNYVRKAFEKTVSLAKAEGLFNSDALGSDSNNEAARTASTKFYMDTFHHRTENLHGCNDTDTAITYELYQEKYVFPKRCSFYSYDVRDITKKIEPNNQYNFILLDPPWWNRSIRRKKSKHVEASYQMMYNEELVKIPIGQLLHPNGIVAIWCTNAPSHLHSIFNEMFPAWGISYKAKWYWVKVTRLGEPICNFNSAPRKQPYELLILGSASKETEVRIPDKKLLISVPSAVHSHKPPLTEIIKEYLPCDPKCLEIFARYLLPGWTSWGLEVLKFQHLSLYTVAQESEQIESIKTSENYDSSKYEVK